MRNKKWICQMNMFGRKRNVAIMLIIGMVMISFLQEGGLWASKRPAWSAADLEPIRVPEGDGRPVLLDGIFSPGEWKDAKKISIRQNIILYLKKYGGHVFLGVTVTPYKTFVVDLFISPDGKNIHHLHASAQICERIINENSGPWDNPAFIYGYSVDWYANEIRWDNEKMQQLMKKGKNRSEAKELSFFKYDGYEFQIKQSKFVSDRWWIRLEVPVSPDFNQPIIYPQGTSMKSTKGWIRLDFRRSV